MKKRRVIANDNNIVHVEKQKNKIMLVTIDKKRSVSTTARKEKA